LWALDFHEELYLHDNGGLLHFHEELYLHKNGGLYTSMTSFTLFEKPTVLHFQSTSPLAVLFQFPLVHDIKICLKFYTR
jgi:hypothetical protein